ncbi:MAG: hypothetical protein HZA53_04135 [Planctomycetes bacterium]|nr:hypothetical protein [Planctomycetota bacterium]
MRTTVFAAAALGVAAAALAPARAATIAAGGTGRDERGPAPAAIVRVAQERLDAKDYAGAREVLERELARGRGDGLLHDLLAQALEKLGARDDAAWRFDLAARAYATEGKENAARASVAGLRRVDPIPARREALEKKLVVDLASGAEELVLQGHAQRALEVLQRLAPLARGKDAERVRALVEKAQSSSKEVDLDRASRSKPDGADWPLVERESRHYRFACQLEPELVQKLGDVMDDLFGHYVQVYFDGDAKKARAEKATLRILPDKKRMLELWAGGGNGPEGWWSPGSNEVITYDVRTRGGALDELLETLYHEASHQFTTLASGGGYVPAWLNEGTASFFEGTRAMADHRVLWPDAALGRLTTLVRQLRPGGTPTALDVVSYSSPASYPAEYYSFGWGLVYFLQEYEDERTLAHVYRPLYARYSTEIVKRGGDPLALYGAVFLGKGTPLGHAGFADFERDWSKWITGTVWPLFGAGREARTRRLERVDRYLAAADAARGNHKAVVSEEELLERALGHVEYVRTRIDGADALDGALVLKQAELLARLERPAAEAPLVETALDLADAGKLALDEARYAELEKRLLKLDRGNAALRTVRSRTAGLTRAARALLDDYRALGDDAALRACTFAAEAGAALDDRDGLVKGAVELRERARGLGRLRGEIRPLDAPAERWTTIFNTPAKDFGAAPGRVTLESVRAMARVLPSIEFAGEYELRARLVRETKPDYGSACGLVVAARAEGDWTILGIDERGQAGIWTVAPSGKDAVTTNRTRTIALDPPVAEDEEPEFVVHVHSDGRIEARVGARASFDDRIALDPTLPRHAGVFAKNGRAAFVDLVVETFP